MYTLCDTREIFIGVNSQRRYFSSRFSSAQETARKKGEHLEESGFLVRLFEDETNENRNDGRISTSGYSTAENNHICFAEERLFVRLIGSAFSTANSTQFPAGAACFRRFRTPRSLIFYLLAGVAFAPACARPIHIAKCTWAFCCSMHTVSHSFRTPACILKFCFLDREDTVSSYGRHEATNYGSR